MHRRILNRSYCILAVVVLAAVSRAVPQPAVTPPPNAPAQISWDAGQRRLKLRYHDITILDATISAEGADGNKVALRCEPAETLGDKVEQRLKFAPAKQQEGLRLVLEGTVIGSVEAFAAETQSEAQKRFPYVRKESQTKERRLCLWLSIHHVFSLDPPLNLDG